MTRTKMLAAALANCQQKAADFEQALADILNVHRLNLSTENRCALVEMTARNALAHWGVRHDAPQTAEKSSR